MIAETNLNHTDFRQYASPEGRWLSPDPYACSLDPSNPQSLNRYAYVLNNPLNLSDPQGLDCVIDGKVDGTIQTDEDCGEAGGKWDDTKATTTGSSLNGAFGLFDWLLGDSADSRNKFSLANLKKYYCNAAPNGSVLAISGSWTKPTLGPIEAGTTGSVEVIYNYDTRESSVFLAAGTTAGIVGKSASISAGNVWGLAPGNTNYKRRVYNGFGRLWQLWWFRFIQQSREPKCTGIFESGEFFDSRLGAS